MEIRNNTPSFGMAFIKPKAEEMTQFTKYVTKGKKPKWVKRGLEQLQEKHSKDIHFDLEYSPECNTIRIKPNTSRAEVLLDGQRTTYPSGLCVSETPYDKAARKCEWLRNHGNFFNKLNALGNLIKEAFKVRFINKTDVLPGNLRAASNDVSKYEKQIINQIQRERVINDALK